MSTWHRWCAETAGEAQPLSHKMSISRLCCLQLQTIGTQAAAAAAAAGAKTAGLRSCAFSTIKGVLSSSQSGNGDGSS